MACQGRRFHATPRLRYTLKFARPRLEASGRNRSKHEPNRCHSSRGRYGNAHGRGNAQAVSGAGWNADRDPRSEEHTSELQSLAYLVCRLLLEKKKKETHKQTALRRNGGHTFARGSQSPHGVLSLLVRLVYLLETVEYMFSSRSQTLSLQSLHI